MDVGRVEIRGADEIQRLLKNLPTEVVSKRGGPVKLALAKGARFIRDREREALRSVLVEGEQSTGLLEENIIASRGKPPSGGNGERYLVRVKRKMYPGRKGQRVSTLKSAQIKEYGSSKQASASFIRRTVRTHGGQAITIIVEDLKARLDRIVKKLASSGGAG
ncbi:hypothetical protein ATCM_01045 [Stenotrophomonas sp. ATCM1_4]|uniref:hypothetical protein n=1 Tax=Stenotrophomonas sp. ATCM1_4 TaxID=2259330 RepID=UPI00104A01A3|nr:hypothetical protein [Stenotrophomonas sp. ATCM1_4]TDB26373.1 hypothetical protein ATCM_01045 [Stenotrophomonas sp. ATCM1_4]